MRDRKKQADKQSGIKRHLLSIFLIALLAVAAAAFLAPVIFTDTRAIVVDGKNFAFIRAKNMGTDEFNLLLQAKLKERYGKNVEINETVELKPAHAARKNISVNTDVVIANLCDVLTVKGECGAIKVNGEIIAIVRSVAEAEQVLRDVLAKYTPDPDEEGESNVDGVEFVDDVVTEPYYADDAEVLSSVQAYDRLTQTEEKSYVYVVRAGDSFNAIANRFGLTEDDLLALNPDINEKTKAMLQIGQKINVTSQVPVYGVCTVLIETVRETVPPPEEEIENLSQYKTYRRIISEGKAGEKMAAYKVYYENGIEIKREPDPSHDIIITSAEPTKIEVGAIDKADEANAATGGFAYPIEDQAYFSSGFGPRDYGSGRHYGIDIACPSGTPVHASDGGTVVHAGWNSGGYGNWVVIDHNNGFRTVYGHNSAVLVRVGEKVHQGQVVALVGSTGDSTGNHLHFEIRLNNKPRNPLELLA